MVRSDLVEESWGTDELDPAVNINDLDSVSTGVDGNQAQPANALLQQDQLISAIGAMMDNKLDAFKKLEEEKKKERPAQLVSIDKKGTDQKEVERVEAGTIVLEDNTVIHGFYPPTEPGESSQDG